MKLRPLALLASLLFAACAVAGENYNVLFISDTHFGDADTFEVDGSGKFRTKKDPHRMEKALPAYQALFKDMAGRVNAETAFVLSGGDLVEGWAKDQASHAAQLRQALTELKSFFTCPILSINGNHDSNGQFGRAAFEEVMVAHLREAAKKPKLKGANYVIRKGGDLWIFHDAYIGKSARERYEYPIQVLRKLDWRPRYVFLVTHSPLLQFTNGPINDLLKELDKHHSFILCGHTHQTQLLTAKRPGGTITQFSVGTCFTEDMKRAQYRVTATTPEQIMPELKRRANKFKNWDKVYRELVPYLSQAWFAKGQGYAVLDISDAGVTITVQSAQLKQKPMVILKDAK